jgi:NADP-dependent 3-hydroxy acid dehydrogenase YdfG
MLKPEGRVAMISGANRGIELATARVLAAKGFTLSLGARDTDSLEAAAAGLPEKRVLCCHWQAAEPETSAAWVARTVERFGRLDAVVANAGLSLDARLEDDDESAYDAMWEVNFKGPLRLVRAAMPRLRQAGSGRVVVLASLSGKRLLSDSLGYAASKFAAVALAHAARRVGWDHGVRATAVCPGMVDTDMVAHRNTPPGEFKIPPDAIAESIAYALSLPNEASVAELLVNSRMEAMF